MATEAPSSHLFLSAPGRGRAAWRFLLFILLYVFLLFAFWFAGVALLALLGGDTLSRDMATVLPTVLSGVPAVVLATILMVVGVDEIIDRPLSYVGLGREPGWPRQLWAGFLLGLAMMMAVVVLEWATGHVRIRNSGR